MASTAYPPGPPSRFPGAHLWAFRRHALEFLCHVSRTYGDVAAFRLGPERVVLVTHPDAIHDVLVTHHRAFIKARRGDVSKQFLGEGLSIAKATYTSANVASCSQPFPASVSRNMRP